MDRNLDGIYFRVNRDGRWKNSCFSDMTYPEKIKMLKSFSKEQMMDIYNELNKEFLELNNYVNEKAQKEMVQDTPREYIVMMTCWMGETLKKLGDFSGVSKNEQE